MSVKEVTPEDEAKFLRAYVKRILIEKGGVRIVAPNECRRMICKLAQELSTKAILIKPIVESILREMLDEMFQFEIK